MDFSASHLKPKYDDALRTYLDCRGQSQLRRCRLVTRYDDEIVQRLCLSVQRSLCYHCPVINPDIERFFFVSGTDAVLQSTVFSWNKDKKNYGFTTICQSNQMFTLHLETIVLCLAPFNVYCRQCVIGMFEVIYIETLREK